MKFHCNGVSKRKKNTQLSFI